MTSLKETIIAKSDQLNSDDLIGGAITVKITKVSLVNGDQPVAISYEGDNGKPWKPCKSMRRVLIYVWGDDGNAFVGKSLTLYRDPSVAFGGAQVGGIRISHMSDIDKPMTMSLTETRNRKKPFTVKPLKVEAATPAPTVAPDPILLEEGLEAADKGVESYTKWIAGLTKEQKAPLREKHKEWTAIAKAADEINAEFEGE